MNAGRQHLARLLLVTLVVLAATADAPAQTGLTGGGSYALAEGERNLSFAGIPIPNYSEVLGFSLGVVGMAYYKLDRHDDLCPPSTTGLLGFYSENNSWIGAAFQQIHYDQDRWRGALAFGLGSIEYQFNPAAIDPGLPDLFLDYTTVTDFAMLEASRLAWNHLYLGLDVVTWTAKVSLEQGLIETEAQRYTGLGPMAELDRADHIFTPTRGWKASSHFLIYDEALGAEQNFTKLFLKLTGYGSLRDSTHVLAARALGELGFGDVPFSSQAIVSGNRNLRGYSDGRYRADQLMEFETEYRWTFWRRWGATAFAGVAFVASDLTKASLDDALPAGGIGLRYCMIQQYRINARVDYGWGKGDQAIYFSIGEAY